LIAESQELSFGLNVETTEKCGSILKQSNSLVTLSHVLSYLNKDSFVAKSGQEKLNKFIGDLFKSTVIKRTDGGRDINLFDDSKAYEHEMNLIKNLENGPFSDKIVKTYLFKGGNLKDGIFLNCSRASLIISKHAELGKTQFWGKYISEKLSQAKRVLDIISKITDNEKVPIEALSFLVDLIQNLDQLDKDSFARELFMNTAKKIIVLKSLQSDNCNDVLRLTIGLFVNKFKDEDHELVHKCWNDYKIYLEAVSDYWNTALASKVKKEKTGMPSFKEMIKSNSLFQN